MTTCGNDALLGYGKNGRCEVLGGKTIPRRSNRTVTDRVGLLRGEILVSRSSQGNQPGYRESPTPSTPPACPLMTAVSTSDHYMLVDQGSAL